MTETLYLLDTNIVLTLVRGNSLAAFIDAEFGLRSAKIRPMICVVTHGEVRVLAARNEWGDSKLEALENALDNLVTVDINHPDIFDAYVAIDLYSQKHAPGARNMGEKRPLDCGMRQGNWCNSADDGQGFHSSSRFITSY